MVLADRKLPEVAVVFVEGDLMSRSEAKWQVRKFLVPRYPADFEESPTADPEEVAGIHLLARDLESEADCSLANSMGGPNFCSPAIIRGQYKRLREACLVIKE